MSEVKILTLTRTFKCYGNIWLGSRSANLIPPIMYQGAKTEQGIPPQKKGPAGSSSSSTKKGAAASSSEAPVASSFSSSLGKPISKKARKTEWVRQCHHSRTLFIFFFLPCLYPLQYMLLYVAASHWKWCLDQDCNILKVALQRDTFSFMCDVVGSWVWTTLKLHVQSSSLDCDVGRTGLVTHKARLMCMWFYFRMWQLARDVSSPKKVYNYRVLISS